MLKRTPIRHKAKQAKVSWRSGRVRLDGSGMRNLRKHAFDRAEGRCENSVDGSRCANRVTWYYGELHHLVHRSRGGSDTMENVAVVCWDCHHAHHNGGAKIVRFEVEA